MKSSLLAACLAATVATPALAQSTDRLGALEARMQALEASAAEMKAQAEAAQAALAEARAEIERLRQAQADAVAVSSPAPAVAAEPAAASSANAFNPAISLILDGQYAHHSLNPDSYERSGFPLVGEGGPGEQGLALGESEMTLSANIDDKFYGQITLAVEGDGGIAVEEGYIDTTALPNGLTLRAGRFFSAIGYLNSHHAHTDKFSDRPLAYQALLGNQYGDDGVQVRWVAPTDLFVELGGEIFRGEGFPSGGAGRAGTGVRTAFAHVGGDIGFEQSWLAGLSVLDARTEGGEDGFRGRNRLWVADATWKWAPQGNFKDGGVTVRGEYLVDDRNGHFIDALDPSLDVPWDGKRKGGYVEAVYRFNRNWETGYRFDQLWSDNTGPYASGFDPSRHSVMLSWLNSEFSLIRLQYQRDRPNSDATDNVLTLQYQVSLGAHGAHKF